MYQTRELLTVPGEYTGLERAQVQGLPRPGGGSRGANLTKIGQGIQLPCQMYINMVKGKILKQSNGYMEPIGTALCIPCFRAYPMVTVSPRPGGSFHKAILALLSS